MSRKFVNIHSDDTYIQGSLKDYIHDLVEALNEVPEEYKDQAIVHIYAVEDYGNAEVIFHVYYDAPDTPEEIEMQRQAEESRKNQEIFNARQVLKKYGIEK